MRTPPPPVDRDVNLARYSTPDVVAHYARDKSLQPSEEQLFARHIKPDMAILDLGVGGGRTTPFLASAARRYVGVDYSRAMVESCRAQYPALEFELADASDLGAFSDASFDAVVFAFNGIDCLDSDASRARCLAEISRLLRDRGVFIFSSHNARSLALAPELRGARGHQIPWRIARAIAKTPVRAARTLRGGAFRPGQGYVWDPVDGGMRTYVSTPTRLIPQLTAAGLETLEVLSGPRPGQRGPYFVRWYYYACRRLPR